MNSGQAVNAVKPLAMALDWWRGVRERWARMAELRDLPPGEFERVAADFGVSPAELMAASARPDGGELLLVKRLQALHIDRDEIAALLPMLLRDLERTCGACPDQRRCAKDMATSNDANDWEAYCPNAGSLRTLR